MFIKEYAAYSPKHFGSFLYVGIHFVRTGYGFQKSREEFTVHYDIHPFLS